MATKLNAATRLRTEVKAAPVSEDTHHTYMASLYTQLLKVLRREFPDAAELKKDVKLINLQGADKKARAIQVYLPGLTEQGIHLEKPLIELGWIKNQGFKGYRVFIRKDGKWPLILRDGPNGTKFLSLASVDDASEL